MGSKSSGTVGHELSVDALLGSSTCRVYPRVIVDPWRDYRLPKFHLGRPSSRFRRVHAGGRWVSNRHQFAITGRVLKRPCLWHADTAGAAWCCLQTSWCSERTQHTDRPDQGSTTGSPTTPSQEHVWTGVRDDIWLVILTPWYPCNFRITILLSCISSHLVPG